MADPKELHKYTSPITLYAEFQTSILEHMLFAGRCSFSQWLHEAQNDFDTAIWMFRYTTFQKGKLPYYLDISNFYVEVEHVPIVQKIIEYYDELTKLSINSTVYEGAHALKFDVLSRLETLKVSFESVLDLQKFKNRSLHSLKIFTDANGPPKIKNSHLLWDQCPNLEKLKIKSICLSTDFLHSLAGRNIKSLTLKYFHDGKSLPDNFFEGKEQIFLKNCSSDVSDHWLNHCFEGNRMVGIRLLLDENRELTKLLNLQSLEMLTLVAKIENELHYYNLVHILKQLKLQKNKQFQLNITIECSSQAKEMDFNIENDMKELLKNWSKRFEHIKINTL